MKDIKIQLAQAFQALSYWLGKEEELKRFRQGPGQWNILQIAEHIALSNHYLLKMFFEEQANAQQHAPDIVGVRGSFNWPHASRLEPSGNVSENQLKLLLNYQFSKCLQVLRGEKNCSGPESIQQNRKLQYLLFMSLHIQRHIAQMEKNEEKYNGQKGMERKAA